MKNIIMVILLLVSCQKQEERVFKILVNEKFDSTKRIEVPSNSPLLIQAINRTSEKILVGYNRGKSITRSKEVPMKLKDGFLYQRKGHSISGHPAITGYDTLRLNKSFIYPLHYNYNNRNTSKYQLYIFIYGKERNDFSLIMDIDEGSYEAFVLHQNQDGFIDYYQITAKFKNKELLPIPFSKENKRHYPMVSTEEIDITFNYIKNYINKKD